VTIRQLPIEKEKALNVLGFPNGRKYQFTRGAVVDTGIPERLSAGKSIIQPWAERVLDSDTAAARWFVPINKALLQIQHAATCTYP
jgi:hypothetical protein